jgi:uncharacterized OB-fold protein
VTDEERPPVTRKLREFTAAAPAGSDVWRDFRRIEILDLELSFKFRHSLGKVSRFFLELERRRLMATRCPRCATVWMPPRPACGDDLAVTEWIELSGDGHLAVAAECTVTARPGAPPGPFVLGYVALEGASTLLLQRIRATDSHALVAGLPLRAVWADAPVAHPMELFWFEPAH